MKRASTTKTSFPRPTLSRPRTSPSVAVLWSLALVAGGAAAGISLTASPDVSELAAADSIESVPVVSDVYADARNARLIPVLSQTTSLTLQVDGIITESTCIDHGVVKSGQALFYVNGLPVIALSTPVPLWRDLDLGSTGTDVTSLQSELVRLGYTVGQDGVFDALTAEAAAAVLKQYDSAHSGTLLSLSSVLWLPDPEVEVDQCSKSVGMNVSSGEPALETSRSLVGITVEAPSDVVAGPRVIAFENVTIDVPQPSPDGTLITSDEELLRAVASSPEFAAQSLSPDVEVGLTASYTLTDAIEVWALPPAAIGAVRGSGGCVMSPDGQLVPVTVIASRLGVALVTLPSESRNLASVRLPAPDSC